MQKKKIVSIYIPISSSDSNIMQYCCHLENLLTTFYYCKVNLIVDAKGIQEALNKTLDTDLFITLKDYSSDDEEIISKTHPDGIIFANTEDEKSRTIANIMKTTSGNRFGIKHQKSLYTNSEDFISLYIVYNSKIGINTAAISSAIALYFGVKETKRTERFAVLKNGTTLLAGSDKNALIDWCDKNQGTVVINSKKEVVHKSKLNSVDPMKNRSIASKDPKKSLSGYIKKLYGVKKL